VDRLFGTVSPILDLEGWIRDLDGWISTLVCWTYELVAPPLEADRSPHPVARPSLEDDRRVPRQGGSSFHLARATHTSSSRSLPSVSPALESGGCIAESA